MDFAHQLKVHFSYCHNISLKYYIMTVIATNILQPEFLYDGNSDPVSALDP